MGASGWTYFVPFQEDIANALRELQEAVFNKGKYFKPGAFYGAMFEQMPPKLKEMMAPVIEEMQGRGEPQSIEELREMNGEDGTHSILDMEGVSATPDFGVLAPLEAGELLDLFGTDKPTRSMIEERAEAVLERRDRWEGTYVIAYKEGVPSEIFFAGFSGD